MQPCDAIDALLPLFVSARLKGPDQRRLAVHLAACEACQDELGRLFQLRSQLDALAARHAPIPTQLDRVFASLKAAPGFDVPSTRFDLRERIPFAEHVQPLMWAQRIIEATELLRSREWTITVGSIAAGIIEVGSITAAPANGP